jgi:hypothetical protein
MSIFSNFLGNDNNEKKAEFIEKLSLFIYINKNEFFENFTQKKRF